MFSQVTNVTHSIHACYTCVNVRHVFLRETFTSLLVKLVQNAFPYSTQKRSFFLFFFLFIFAQVALVDLIFRQHLAPVVRNPHF